jgi:Na+-driven multidrug efflux pump
MLPVMQFFSDEIISIFVSDAEVIVYGSTGMIITSWFYLALGTIYVIRGTLNGVGDAMFALINGVVEVIGRIVIPVTLITIPAIGVWGLWGSAAVVWVISALFSIWRYASWRKKNPLIE